MKIVPSVASLNLPEFGGRCRKAMLGLWLDLQVDRVIEGDGEVTGRSTDSPCDLLLSQGSANCLLKVRSLSQASAASAGDRRTYVGCR